MKRKLDKEDKCNEAKAKWLGIIMTQCLPKMKDKLEAQSTELEKLEDDSDVIGLSDVIKELVSNAGGVRNKFVIINESLNEHGKRFLQQVEVIEAVWGNVVPPCHDNDSAKDKESARNQHSASCPRLPSQDSQLIVWEQTLVGSLEEHRQTLAVGSSQLDLCWSVAKLLHHMVCLLMDVPSVKQQHLLDVALDGHWREGQMPMLMLRLFLGGMDQAPHKAAVDELNDNCVVGKDVCPADVQAAIMVLTNRRGCGGEPFWWFVSGEFCPAVN